MIRVEYVGVYLISLRLSCTHDSATATILQRAGRKLVSLSVINLSSVQAIVSKNNGNEQGKLLFVHIGLMRCVPAGVWNERKCRTTGRGCPVKQYGVLHIISFISGTGWPLQTQPMKDCQILQIRARPGLLKNMKIVMREVNLINGSYSTCYNSSKHLSHRAKIAALAGDRAASLPQQKTGCRKNV